MSVVIADFGVNGRFPVTVGGTGTPVKYFGRNAATAAGATWVSAPTTPSSSNAKGCLLVPGDNKLNSQLFNVKAAGTFTQGATESSSEVTVSLYAVTGSYASPTYTTLASTASYANAADSVAYGWAINATLIGDTASGLVGGSYAAYVAGALSNSTPKNIANVLTSINFATGNSGLDFAPFGLVVGVTFGQSFSDNAASMYEFTIEA